MKRFIALFLACLCLFTLVGCKDKDNDAEPELTDYQKIVKYIEENGGYIVVETNYTGPRFFYKFDIKDHSEIADCCEKACENAFTQYSEIAENQDVPAAELYQSVRIAELSTTRPFGY